jgi:hypothetical protein
MTPRARKLSFVGLLLLLPFGGWLYVNYKPVDDLAAGDITNNPGLAKQSATPSTVPPNAAAIPANQPSGPDAEQKGDVSEELPIPTVRLRNDSISQQEDGPLAQQARDLLLEPDETKRAAQWQSLLSKADFHTLVRMTELPAVPELDEGRRALRMQALEKIVKTNQMAKFMELRMGFDGGGASLTQVSAWEQWGAGAPKQSIPEWLKKSSATAPDWMAKRFAKSLLEANPVEVSEALENLPQQTQAYFFMNFSNLSQKNNPEAAAAWKQKAQDIMAASAGR